MTGFVKRHIVRATQVLTLTGLLLAGFSGVGHAQGAAPATSRNLTVTPSSTSLSLDPGASKQQAFEVINGGDTAFTVKTTVAPYRVEGENYDPLFTSLPGKTDASKWVKLDKTSNTAVQGRQVLSVPYTVTVPEGTAPGGYYAVVFAETVNTNPSAGVVSNSRVGNILYLTVNGDVETKASVEASALPAILFTDKLEPGVRINNTGGVHFLSTTKVSIRNILGKEVYNNELKRYVLPETTRLVNGSWDNVPPIGLFKVSRQAEAAGNRQQLPDKWVFVIRPWVMVALLIVIVVAIFWFINKRRGTRKTT